MGVHHGPDQLRYNICSVLQDHPCLIWKETIMQNDFDLLKTFNNLLRKWWLILSLAVLGGLVGLAISYILSPLYQAEAVFHASIDFNKVDIENLNVPTNDPYVFTQYDEDLALQAVQRMLVWKSNAAYDYALTLDPSLEREEFEENSQIKRYHAQWYLRFRHEDPAVAQAVVNYWAELGYKALQIGQESGRVESFVIVDLISEAYLPQVLQYRHRNALVLAGTIIGLVIGVIVVDSKIRFVKLSKSEV